MRWLHCMSVTRASAGMTLNGFLEWLCISDLNLGMLWNPCAHKMCTYVTLGTCATGSHLCSSGSTWYFWGDLFNATLHISSTLTSIPCFGHDAKLKKASIQIHFNCFCFTYQNGTVTCLLFVQTRIPQHVWYLGIKQYQNMFGNWMIKQ